MENDWQRFGFWPSKYPMSVAGWSVVVIVRSISALTSESEPALYPVFGRTQVAADSNIGLRVSCADSTRFSCCDTPETVTRLLMGIFFGSMLPGKGDDPWP